MVPERYNDIVEQLGHIIPCYSRQGAGCHAADSLDGEMCEPECLMLRIYRAGYDAAIRTPSTGEDT